MVDVSGPRRIVWLSHRTRRRVRRALPTPPRSARGRRGQRRPHLPHHLHHTLGHAARLMEQAQLVRRRGPHRGQGRRIERRAIGDHLVWVHAGRPQSLQEALHRRGLHLAGQRKAGRQAQRRERGLAVPQPVGRARAAVDVARVARVGRREERGRVRQEQLGDRPLGLIARLPGFPAGAGAGAGPRDRRRTAWRGGTQLPASGRFRSPDPA